MELPSKQGISRWSAKVEGVRISDFWKSRVLEYLPPESRIQTSGRILAAVTRFFVRYRCDTPAPEECFGTGGFCVARINVHELRPSDQSGKGVFTRFPEIHLKFE